jgi:cellobiose-specific phosphotransferase system component IIA
MTSDQIDAILLKIGATGGKQVWFTRQEAIKAVQEAARQEMEKCEACIKEERYRGLDY